MKSEYYKNIKAIKCRCCGLYIIIDKYIKHENLLCPTCVYTNCKHGMFIKIHKKEILNILKTGE